MRFRCAFDALSMRFRCAFDALSVRFLCALCALCVRFVCAFYALSMRFVCASYARVCACIRLYALVCALYVLECACMRFVCALYALCLRFVCALYGLGKAEAYAIASPRRRNTFKLRAARHGAVCLIFHIPSVMGWAWMYVKMGCFSVLLKPSYLEKVRKRRNVKLPR